MKLIGLVVCGMAWSALAIWMRGGSGGLDVDVRNGLQALCTASAACELTTVPAGWPAASQWRLVATQPTLPHTQGTVAAVGDTVWLLNGFQGERHRAAATVFHPDTTAWTVGPKPKVLYPTKMLLGTDSAAVYVKPHLYLIGGLWGYVSTLSEVHVVDADAHLHGDFAEWVSAPGMPTPRKGHACAVVHTDIFCGFGRVDLHLNKNRNHPSTFTTVMEVYSTTSETWSAGVPSPGRGREHAVAAVVGDRVYFIGGVEANPKNVVEIMTVATVEVFYTESSTWSIAAPLPTPLASGLVAVDGTESAASVYWLGGFVYSPTGSASHAVDVMYRLDTAINAWTVLDPLPLSMAGGAAAIIYGGQLFAVHGFTIEDSERLPVPSIALPLKSQS